MWRATLRGGIGLLVLYFAIAAYGAVRSEDWISLVTSLGIAGFLCLAWRWA